MGDFLELHFRKIVVALILAVWIAGSFLCAALSGWGAADSPEERAALASENSGTVWDDMTDAERTWSQEVLRSIREAEGGEHVVAVTLAQEPSGNRAKVWTDLTFDAANDFGPMAEAGLAVDDVDNLVFVDAAGDAISTIYVRE